MTLSEEMINCMKSLPCGEQLDAYIKMAKDWQPIRSEYIYARIDLLIAIDERLNNAILQEENPHDFGRLF